MSLSNKVNSQKTALYILLAYILCQLSGFLLLIPNIKEFFLGFINADPSQTGIILAGWWSTVTFALTFIVCLLFISGNKSFWNIFKGEKASIGVSIGWGILGFFLVLFGQMIGANIEIALGIDYGSENTETIMMVTEIAPIMIFASVLFGPVLEELVFRRVVFGSLIQTQNFWIAGLISSIVFAAVHLDFTHIILYSISGFIFAYLYYKTKRLLTSIIAHIMLNGFVTISQTYFDDIQKMYEEMQLILFFLN